MKKSTPLLLISLTSLLFSCNGASIDDENSNSSSNTATIITSSSEITDGTETAPITTQEDFVNVVSIDSIIKKPEYLYEGDTISPTEILLSVTLSNGLTKTVNPDYVEVDYETKNEDETVNCVIHYKTFEVTFIAPLRTYIVDVLDSSVSGVTGSYAHWGASSSSGAQYDAITGGTNSTLQFNASSSAGKPGLVSTYSAGKVSKVEVVWNEKTSTNRVLNLYGKNTPFSSVNNISGLSNEQLIHGFSYDAENPTESFKLTSDVHYIAFASSAALYMDSITIYWDSYNEPATLTSMVLSGSATANNVDKIWDLSNVIVTGTFSNGNVTTINDLCSIEVETLVPDEVTDSLEIVVNAKYLRDETITANATLTGVISQGTPTAANYYYGEDTLGGTMSFNKLSNNTDKSCYQESASADEETYLQVFSSTKYWESLPSEIILTATLGGGSSKSFAEGYEVYASLLDENGDVIEETTSVLTNAITNKNPLKYTIQLTPTENVYGVRISHKKLSRYNLRYYGVKLQYNL